MARSGLPSLLAVKSVGSDQYVSEHHPRNMGNASPIAYGGNTMGVAVLTAHKSVNEGFFMFSAMGSFLGPTRVDRKLYCRVFRTRDTKTFATRRVVAYQIQDDGSERNCAEILVEFHVQEPSMFTYSAQPSSSYFCNPEDRVKTAANAEIADRLLRSGQVSQAAFDLWNKAFSLSAELFEVRQCLDSVSGQNLYGLAKDIPTTQDHLPITEKSCAEWFKVKAPLHDTAQQASALTFWMDGALSFLPLNLDHKGLHDAGPCSTLEFALRLFVPTLDLNSWHLRERKTIAAQGARTYSESRLWDQKGQMVAVMTQTCICRPPPVTKANL